MDAMTTGQADALQRSCPAVQQAQVGARLKDAVERIVVNESDIVTAKADIISNLATVEAETKILVVKVEADATTPIAVAGLSEGDEVIGAYVICTVDNANGTLVLQDGAATTIADGMLCAVDKVVTQVANIDDSKSTIPASGAQIASIGGTTATTRGIMVITYIPA